MSVTERRVAPAEPIQASGSGGSETPRLEVHEISKHFGSVVAVDRVSFSVGRGEVVGLLGDNGAGKSTIIKMISGALRPDSGYLALDGKRLNLRSAKDARRAGIATVYQDLGLVTTMSVWRNFFLGAELRKNLLFLDVKKMRDETKEALRLIGLKNLSSVDQTVMGLSGGERQALSIGRAVYFEQKLLVLDEPTAALSVKETEKVGEYVREAKSRELGVILVMHNVLQALELCDRVVVMRHGRTSRDIVVRGEPGEVEEVTRAIIGL
jgi:simple sugar transport system ATP-binding protein